MPLTTAPVLEQSVELPTIHSTCIAFTIKAYMDMRLANPISDFPLSAGFSKFLLKHLLGCECNMRQYEEDLRLVSQTIHNQYMDILSTIFGENSLDAFLTTLEPKYIGQEEKLSIHPSCLAMLFIRKFIVSINLSLSSSESYIHFYKQLRHEYTRLYGSAPASTLPTCDKQASNLHQNFARYFKNPMIKDADGKRTDDVPMETNATQENEVEISECDSVKLDGDCTLYKAERFIAQQAQYLEYCEEYAESPRDLEASIHLILDLYPDLAPAHFLRYLNLLRLPDVTAAMQALATYFSAVQLTVLDGCKSPHFKAAHQQDLLRRSTRYAALGLASFLARMGNKDEALLSLKECIRASQYVADNLCLQHAACWLYRLNRQDTVEMLYERALFKAGEYGLYYLAFMVVQVFVRHKVMRRIKPSSVFEVLIKSDMLQYQHAALPLSMASCAQKAALWKIYAHRDLSLLYAQMLLHINCMSVVSPGRPSLRVRAASGCPPSSTNRGVYHSGQSVVMAYCHLIHFSFDEGELPLCRLLLDHVRSTHGSDSTHSPLIEAALLYPAFTLALCEEKWQVAEDAINKLANISTCKAAHWRAVLLIHQKRGPEAEEIIRHLLAMFDGSSTGSGPSNGEVEYHNEFQVSLILSLVDTYCMSSTYSKCVPLLSKAGSICKDYYLHSMDTLTAVYTAHILYLEDMSDQALLLLNNHMYKVLTCLRCLDKARTLLLYSRCVVASFILRNQTEQEVMRTACEKCLLLLSQAESIYKTYKANRRLRDVLHMQSILYHKIGDKANRNRLAQDFVEIDTKLDPDPPLSTAGSSGLHYLL